MRNKTKEGRKGENLKVKNNPSNGHDEDGRLARSDEGGEVLVEKADGNCLEDVKGVLDTGI